MTRQRGKWAELVDEQYRRDFAFPKGWSTKEEVAVDLGCTPDRVRDVLRPAIAAGRVESALHKVWHEGRMVKMMGYRMVKPAPAGK